MSQIVGIVDYSVNNISSITKFLNKLDINFKVINKSKDIHKFGFLTETLTVYCLIVLDCS